MAYPLRGVLANNTHKWLIALRIVLIIILLWWMSVSFLIFPHQRWRTKLLRLVIRSLKSLAMSLRKVTGNDHIKIKLTVTYRSQFKYGIRKLAPYVYLFHSCDSHNAAALYF